MGFAASMCTHIPFSAVTWAVYEQSRRYMYRGGSADNADADGWRFCFCFIVLCQIIGCDVNNVRRV